MRFDWSDGRLGLSTRSTRWHERPECERVEESDSTPLNSIQTALPPAGTPFYMSPEMINLEQTRGGYDEKSDIWALGCLIYELCALAPPFDATNHMALVSGLRNDATPVGGVS